jgi:hypothetical protein
MKVMMKAQLFPKSGLMMLTMLMKNPESPPGERFIGTFPFLGQHHQHHQPQPQPVVLSLSTMNSLLLPNIVQHHVL